MWTVLLLCLCFAAADFNFVPDWDHAPFLHGVASADPSDTRVLIWTRVSIFPEGPEGGPETEVAWWLWPEDALPSVRPLRQGSQLASAASDFTVAVDVTGLQPGTRYAYQFSAAGNRSVKGRTKTAGNSSQVDLAILSCTSLWSGFFNFYRRLAAEDVDAVVHVGDLIYEKPDQDELVRVPPIRCDEGGSRQAPDLVMDTLRDALCSRSDLVRYRALHSIHMFDPDFRLARSRHPFIAMYDNHDINWKDANSSLQAWTEWVPMRLTRPVTSGSYRHFRFGNGLLDVFLLDTSTAASKESLLGSEQESWLADELGGPPGSWRLFGSPKTFMPLALNKIGVALGALFAGVAAALLLPMVFLRLLRRSCAQEGLSGLGNPKTARHLAGCCSCCACCAFWLWTLAGASICTFLALKLDSRPDLNLLHATRTTWEGQPSSRDALFEQLRQSGLTSNNIWAVGDMHFSYLADVFQFDHQGKDLLSYSPSDGSTQSYGVEFMPGSGSRGNMDEKAGEVLGSLFKPQTLLCRLVTWVVDYAIAAANPHFRHFEGSEHGYGLLKITPERVEASWVRFDILQLTESFRRVSGMYVKAGENKWCWDPASTRTCEAGI